ncbi:hypothetical protein [Moheibacter lacus]|uniref:Lipoprotein n=1 Tax=Moheibacter lacus TaxID=2745851 RepID=A0A838ZRY9_9FLAO|nr:hypothetical protein [Moheibacter lacus]MBA5629722.1 hypothetical protein [Moheibacter lacus]
MKKLLLMIPFMLMIFLTCSEESAELAELSAEYDIPVEVLKSNEFKEFMLVIEESTRAKAKIDDEFFKATSASLEKKEAVQKIIEMSQKKEMSIQELEKEYHEKVGVSPFNSELLDKVKEKREAFFKKFPEYEGNREKLAPFEKYFKNEVMNYEQFMLEREEEIFNDILSFSVRNGLD